MWFLSARNARRTPSASPKRGAFRPRLEALEDRCLLSANNLDLSFGTNGVVTGPITEASAVVVYPNTGSHPATDGKIVAGGFEINAQGYNEFALVRYLPSGLLDSSVYDSTYPFGTNGSGVVETAVGLKNSNINGLAIDANGNIVAVGTALIHYKKSDYNVFAVARYTSTGVLDTTFGSGGIATTITGAGAFAVAIDGSGNIDVAGTANTNTGDEFALARYLPTGALDTKNFNPSGRVPGLVETPQSQFAGQPARADAITIDTIQPSNADIVVAGTSGNAVAVARYTSTGGLDPYFNDPTGKGIGNGIVQGLKGPTTINGTATAFLAHGVLVQSVTGDIVVAGNYFPDVTLPLPTSTEDQILVRLTPSGSVDHLFGGATNNQGYVINTQLYGALALTQTASGVILAASATTLALGTNEMGVAAFNADGTADAGFWGPLSVSDTTSIPYGPPDNYFSGGLSWGLAMAIDGNGNIVVAGFTIPTASSGYSSYTIALARFVP